MGKSSGNQTVTNKTTLPAWYTDVAKVMMDQAQAAASSIAKPYQGNTVSGLDPLTSQAINSIGQNVGSSNAAYQQAQQGASGVMNYNPQMVANGYQAQMVGTNYQPQNVSVGNSAYNYAVDPVSAGQGSYNYNPTQVNGGSFLSGNMGAYMSPYIQNVEQAAMTNMNQQLQQGINTIGDAAINARAFGGSRQGVREGVAISDAARQMGDFSANLRNQAYNDGAQRMESDMARSMQAQLANQQTGMSNAQFGANIGMQNIGNSLQAALANQQAGSQNAQFGANLGLQNLQNQLQAQQSNQSAGLQGAQLNQQGALANQGALYNQYAMQQQAALANQQAGLQGAQLNLSGANSMGDLASNQQTAYLQGLQQAVSAGQINQQQAQQLLDQNVNRYDAMANIPANQLNLLLAGLSGTQVPTTSTTKTPTSGNWLTGAAGGAMAGMPFGPFGMLAGGLLGGVAGA